MTQAQLNTDPALDANAVPRLISINIGQLRQVDYRGRQILTGIYKSPVEGPVLVRRLNLDGDKQADLSVHGGIDKAVYLYPFEHYESWRSELGRDLAYGHFGENLTVSGLLEDSVRVGDLLTIGEAVLEVTQPRVPCFKLGIKMKDQRFLRRFLESGRSGFYCRVLSEGLIEAGQQIGVQPAAVDHPKILDLVHRIRRG